MVDDGIHELTPPPLPTAEELARAGGWKGATIVKKGRSGEQAIRDWEKEHGSLNEPTFKRNRRKDEVGEI